MARRDIKKVGEELVALASNLDLSPDAIQSVLDVVVNLMNSVYKSAEDPGRGDFAKGREQMAMHAIALLVGAKDWKQIERILFGDSNGD
jgi:hypothetical protein